MVQESEVLPGPAACSLREKQLGSAPVTPPALSVGAHRGETRLWLACDLDHEIWLLSLEKMSLGLGAIWVLVGV